MLTDKAPEPVAAAPDGSVYAVGHTTLSNQTCNVPGYTVGATRYGTFTTRHASNPAQDQAFDPKWTLDASASFRPGQHWTVTVGADNLLDEYPEQAIFANSTSGLLPYSLYSPFGFNGRYLYGRVAYKW